MNKFAVQICKCSTEHAVANLKASKNVHHQISLLLRSVSKKLTQYMYIVNTSKQCERVE